VESFRKLNHESQAIPVAADRDGSRPARGDGAVSGRALRSRPPALRARELADANLRALEQPVLRAVKGRLASQNKWVPLPDLEGAYNQAWHGVYETIAQGRQVENLTGLLIDITYKRSVDIYRQRREALQGDEALDGHAVDVDLAEQLDDQRKFERLIGRLVEQLSPKERNGVTLCVLHGYKRPEAARRLGIPEPAFQKIMDSATQKIARVVGGIAARGCGDEEWSRALRSYALGLMDAEHRDYPRVREHIEGCATCRRYVQGLRGLAAALPPVVPVGHDLAAVLAHLHKLFAPTHGVTAGVATAQTTAAVAGGAAAGSTATGGGMAGLFGGGAVKALIIVAGLAAAGTLAIGGQAHHHPRPAHPAASRPPAVPSPAITQSSLLSPVPARGFKATRTPRAVARSENVERRQRPGRLAPQLATDYEFGVEGGHPITTPHPAATVASHSPTPPPPPPPAARKESGSNDFGFERTK
jgi:DNA-directed RNA polymerase specialized sigma24 family protein